MSEKREDNNLCATIREEGLGFETSPDIYKDIM